jgi:carbonic anhydrase
LPLLFVWFFFQPASAWIVTNYQPSAVNILNNGHTIQVNYDTGSSIEVDGDTYNLLQFHFHAGSENTVDGSRFPLEMHLVHANAQGGLAVVGVLFSEGAENAAFTGVWDNLPAAEGGPDTISGASVDASALLPADQTYYRFAGSLTTPPCSESVKWFVMQNSVEMSAAQLASFEAIYTGNFRPVQPMNAREFIVGSPPDSLPTTGAGLVGQLPAGLILSGFTLMAAGLATHAARRRKRT